MTASRPSRTWPLDLLKAIVALLLLAAMLYLRPDLSASLQRQMGLPVGSLTVLDAPAAEAGTAAVTLSGRTQAGATVDLFAGASRLGSATAAADGTWSLPVTLPTGSYELRAQARDAAGTPLGAPATLAWSGGAQTTGQQGATEPGSTPATTPGTEASGTEAAGTEPAGAEASGTEASGAEPAGAEAASGAPPERDNSTPAAADTGASTADDEDESGATAAAGASGATAFAMLPEPAAVSPQGVTLTGTGTPGAAVDIVGAEGILTSATVDPDGAWSAIITLPPGTYELLARTTDLTGERQSSPVVSVTVPNVTVPDATAPDTTAPDTTARDTTAPDITAPGATSAPAQTALGAAQVLAGAANLSGRGAPGSTVEIIVRPAPAGGAGTSTAAGATVILGSTVVGPDGMWSLRGTVPPGEYQLSLRTLDEDGTVVATSPAVPFSVPADTDEEATGLAVAPSAAPAAEETTVLTATTVIRGEPAAGEVGAAATATRTGTLTGTNAATSTATVTGAVTADTPLAALEQPGTAPSTPAAGRGTVTTTVNAAASPTAASPTAASPTAASLAAPSFAQPTYAGNTLTLRGAGDPGSTVEIVSGATVVKSATVGADGEWALTAEIAPGSYQLRLIRRDAAGAVVGQSPQVSLKIPAADRPLTAATPEAGASSAVTPTAVALETGASSTVTLTVAAPEAGTTSAVTPTAAAPEADASSAVTLTAAAAATAEATAETSAEGSGEARAYTVQTGDTLTGLAQQYLGNQARYREIVAATNERAQQDSAIDPITNADVITVGQTIWIPAR